MKILFLTDKPSWPPDSGGAIGTGSLVTGLKMLGHKVTMLSVITPKHSFDPNESLNREFSPDKIVTVEIDTSIKPGKLIVNFIFSRKPYSVTRFDNIIFRDRLKELLKEDYDVIAFEALNMTNYLGEVRKHFNGLCIYRPHNVENLIWWTLSNEETNFFKKYFFRVLSKRLLKLESAFINRFDAVTPVSEQELEWFMKQGLAVDSEIIRPGFSIKPSTNGKDEFPYSVGYIGSLDWNPNLHAIDWFCRLVWPLVNKELPSATFHIAGRNPSLKVKEGLNGRNIVFHGMVPSSTDFIKSISVVVSPLFSGSGVRIKILEAMSLGKAVVANDIATTGLNTTPGNEIHTANDPAGFAERIVFLLNSSESRRMTGDKAQEFIRKNNDILAEATKFVNLVSRLSDGN
ncbi:MAG: glycosyltransferase family 4 protein [Bacteroidales bacterium]